MRKVLVLGVMAALAFGAWADNSYYVRVNTGLAATVKGAFSQNNIGYYSAYSVTDEQAAKLMGIEYKAGDRISAAAVQTWLNQNYVANASAWMTVGTKANNYYHYGVMGDPYTGNRMYTDFDFGGSKYATAEEAFEANRLIILFYHGPDPKGSADKMNGYRIAGLDSKKTPLKDGMWAVSSVTTGDWAGDGTSDSGWVLSAGPAPAPIPEPTSALLMLLGVAGLALKRKCA